MVKILVLCVSWFARKLVYRQTDRPTDRHGDNISVFFPMRKKSAKNKQFNYTMQCSDSYEIKVNGTRTDCLEKWSLLIGNQFHPRSEDKHLKT